MSAPKLLKFHLERWIQRGAVHQLLFVAGLVAATAVSGGLVARAATDAFDSTFDAVWWSFLRLTDPGYLGDDEGAVLRTISTVVTVLGYVLFMGSLIAIMTQWLSRTLRELESGLTPISMQGHVVILGWTNRTPELVTKLLGGRGRLTRFLIERGVRRLRIVVLSDRVDAERRLELREHAAELWDENQVFLRSGTSLEPEHLERLDLRRAAVIVIPGSDFELGGAELSDTRVVKTLLTLRGSLRSVPVDRRPFVVAEIFDPLKIQIAESTLEGRLEVIASDAVISRVISQSVRHHRLARVFLEFLSHREGNSLYVRSFPQLAGASPLALNALFPRAVVIGAVRLEQGRAVTHLNPPPGFRLEPGDLLVLVARYFEECEPAGNEPPPEPPWAEPSVAVARAGPSHGVLLLGWSYKVGAILSELGSSDVETFAVTIVSRVPVDERERALVHVPFDRDRVRIEHVEDDYAVLGVLEGLDLTRFESVIFLASSSMLNSEEADARTILGYVLLDTMLAARSERPEVLVEVLDPMNSRLFADRGDGILVSPRVLSHLLAHVALRPELNSVYTALFVTGGAEITLRAVADYGLQGRPVSFADLERAAQARGELALGVLAAEGGGHRAPLINPQRERTWTLAEGDEVVVLAGGD